MNSFGSDEILLAFTRMCVVVQNWWEGFGWIPARWALRNCSHESVLARLAEWMAVAGALKDASRELVQADLAVEQVAVLLYSSVLVHMLHQNEHARVK